MLAKFKYTDGTNGKLLIEKLRYHEVKCVVADFSGSGDSGSIDSITVYPLDNTEDGHALVNEQMLGSVLVPEAVMEHEELDWSVSPAKIRDWKKKPPTLKEVLLKFCYDLLEREHSGWEIDAGASGAVIIEPLAHLENREPIALEIAYGYDSDYDSDSDEYNDE